MAKKNTAAKIIYTVLVIILCAVFCLRALGLDRDIPAWPVLRYAPVDEGYYASAALDWQRADSLTESDYEVGFGSTINYLVVMNAITAVTFSVFGDTYYGLRMASAITAGAGTLFLMLALNVLYRRFKFCGENAFRIFKLGVLAYMTFDFSYLMASRIAEPGIYRAAFLALTVLVFALFEEKRPTLAFFAFGFMISVNVMLVYPTNAFMLLAALFLVLFAKKGTRLKKTLAGVGGIAAGAALSELILRLVMNTSFIDVVVKTYNSYVATSLANEGRGIAFSLAQLGENFKLIFASNIFRYAPALAVLFAASLAVNVALCFKNKEPCDTLITFLTLGAVVLHIMAEDFVQRKFVMVLPLIMLGFFVTLRHKDEVWAFLKKRRLLCTLIIAAMCAAVFALELLTLRAIPESFLNANMWLYVLLFLPLVLIIAALLFAGKKVLRRTAALLIFLLLIGGSAGLSKHYVVDYRYYTEKNIMMALGYTIGDSMVLGGYPRGFMLYNDIKPISSGYDVYDGADEYVERLVELSYRDDVNYFFDYDRSYEFHTWFQNDQYTFIEAHRFERSYYVDDPTETDMDFILFIKVLQQYE